MLETKCPKCNKKDCRKDGFAWGRQRYKCKSCNFRHTVQKKSYSSRASLKRHALHLYLEGMGFRGIGRSIKVSHVSVYRWIKAFGKKITSLKNTQTPIRHLEIDEMHTFILKKNTVGYGLLLIELKKNMSVSHLAEEILKQD